MRRFITISLCVGCVGCGADYRPEKREAPVSPVQDDSQYRHCWLVRFTDPAVIASYRDHPQHRAFADERFRPYAGGRISIDYAEAGKNTPDPDAP